MKKLIDYRRWGLGRVLKRFFPVLRTSHLAFGFAFSSLICLLGCQKHNELDIDQRCEVERKIGQDDDIVGNWKLIKGQTVFYEPHIADYSCDNVGYEFSEDGTLVVIGDTEHMAGFEAGQYTYQLRYEPFLEVSDEEFTLQIGGVTMGCEVSADAMTLNSSYLDGPILHFVRVK